jgi:hypothetical protein
VQDFLNVGPTSRLWRGGLRKNPWKSPGDQPGTSEQAQKGMRDLPMRNL